MSKEGWYDNYKSNYQAIKDLSKWTAEGETVHASSQLVCAAFLFPTGGSRRDRRNIRPIATQPFVKGITKMKRVLNVEDLIRRNRHAIDNRIADISRIGTSKYESRKIQNEKERQKACASGTSEEGTKSNRAESPFIHSYSTMHQYRQIGYDYAAWLAKTHPESSKLAYGLRMGYAHEYIDTQIKRGLSASTIARSSAALAKILNCHSYDIHSDLPVRKYSEFTRSRGYCESEYNKDLLKYGVIVELCRIIGARECELEHLYPECFRNDADGNIYCHLDGHKQHTKGGKTRDVTIISSNQKRLRSILTHFEPGKLICPNAPSHLDIHGIRSLYAMDYYATIARNIDDIPENERMSLKHRKIDNSRPNQLRTSCPGVYTRRSDGRKFDRKALLIVSASLGHSREDVVVHSYLR
jgi:hypothetical protein